MSENTINTGTGQGLVDFLTYVQDKGLLNKNTAGALRAAARELLSIEHEDIAKIDIRELDVEQLAQRFANLRAGKFAPQSLETYQSRFRKSVSMYLRFLDNPAGWRPDVRTRPPAAPDRTRGRSNGAPPGPTLPPPASSGMIQYPFPIREGVIASLTLPTDLRRAEARRLASFLESLAVDDQKALPSGTEARGQ
jgi:hypothetical protein